MARFTAMTGIVETPEPPYVAVIFTSRRTAGDHGYAAMAERMDELAAEQPGYLGIESARDGLGITVSYWTDEAAAQAWKQVAEHRAAQELGKRRWYEAYTVRIATVTRSYSGPRTADRDASPVRSHAEVSGVRAVAARMADTSGPGH